MRQMEGSMTNKLVNAKVKGITNLTARAKKATVKHDSRIIEQLSTANISLE